jgi:hypothetical protein
MYFYERKNDSKNELMYITLTINFPSTHIEIVWCFQHPKKRAQTNKDVLV